MGGRSFDQPNFETRHDTGDTDEAADELSKKRRTALGKAALSPDDIPDLKTPSVEEQAMRNLEAREVEEAAQRSIEIGRRATEGLRVKPRPVKARARQDVNTVKSAQPELPTQPSASIVGSSEFREPMHESYKTGVTRELVTLQSAMKKEAGGFEQEKRGKDSNRGAMMMKKRRAQRKGRRER